VHPSCLYFASEEGDVEEVKEILRNHPHFGSEGVDRFGRTAIYYACSHDYDSIVSLFLTHPGIDVNQNSADLGTPFMDACQQGQICCAMLFLKDSRVKVNEPNSTGYTPLRQAAGNGHLDIIRWWIASGRDGSG